LPLGSKRRKPHSLVSLVYRRNNDILAAQLRGKGAKMKIQIWHPFFLWRKIVAAIFCTRKIWIIPFICMKELMSNDYLWIVFCTLSLRRKKLSRQQINWWCSHGIRLALRRVCIIWQEAAARSIFYKIEAQTTLLFLLRWRLDDRLTRGVASAALIPFIRNVIWRVFCPMRAPTSFLGGNPPLIILSGRWAWLLRTCRKILSVAVTSIN
jgi:hypothetical protein